MDLRNSRALWWAVCLAAGLLAPGLQGDQDTQNPAGTQALKNLSLEELSEVEVTTPSKQPVRAFQTPAAVYVITNEDIRRSGVTNIPDALRLAPGVEVAQIDSNKWSIGIRGFGTRLSRSVLVMIDGRTVYTELFAGTYWEVQNVLLEDVDRIEVIRGPGGTIWGPNAVNGVINIITKSSKDTRGGFAQAGGGNHIQGFGNFRYGAGNPDGLTYRVYGFGLTRGPEYHTDGRNFDDWRSVQGGFRLDWGENTRDAFSIEGDLYKEEGGESVQATMYMPPYLQIIDANVNLSGGNLNGRWRRTLANGGDFQLQIYYDRYNRWEPNLADRRGTYDVDFVEHLPAPAREQITWGLSGQVTRIDDPVVVSGLQFLPIQRTDQLYSAFLQDEIGLIENRLSLTAGTKLLKTNFTGAEFEPSARLLWTPSEKQSIWGAFTHALRTPSDAEENFYLLGFTGSYVNGLPLLARFNPNPKFAPEQLNGYELGFRQLFGPEVLVDITSFYNHYHDLFDEEIAGPASLEDNPLPVHYLLPAQFRNGLLGTTKGVEVAPEWRPTNSWRLRGTYSYLYMNITKAPHSGDLGTAPGTVGASPQHEATIESWLDLSKTLQLDLTYRYVSQLPAQLVPSYSTGDARFAWRFAPQWEFSVVGRNLLQPHHAEYAGDPGPLVLIRRSGYLSVTWRR